MIRAANHSSYPRFGDETLDERLRRTIEACKRGEAAAADLTEVQDEVTGVVVAEQSRAFIDIVTDGMVRWEGPLAHPARHLDGLEPGDEVPWFDTGLRDRRPVCSGPVRHRGPFLVHGFHVARDVAQTPVKTVLPGPVTFARLVDDRHYRDTAALARALAGALAEEVRALSAAGASHFQLDEPMLCRHPQDLELVAETAAIVFAAAGEGATTVLSTYFGSLAALADRLERLPGTHLGLDLASGDDDLELLARLPAGRGVVLGLWDARSEQLEDAADVAERLAPHRDSLMRRDVIVGPQAGLEALPRDTAFDKLQQARYLVEKLRREWS